MDIIKDLKGFEEDVKSLTEKFKDDSYAQAFYAALCNIVWKKYDGSDCYSCSWRYAGGLIAEIRDMGEDYMDFYCSGNEGRVRRDILNDLGSLGWVPTLYDNDWNNY